MNNQAASPSPGINVNQADVNLPKINTKKSKRRGEIDDEYEEDFERDEKGVAKGKSQAELVRGKDVGKKRMVSQNALAGGDGRNIQILNR